LEQEGEKIMAAKSGVYLVTVAFAYYDEGTSNSIVGQPLEAGFREHTMDILYHSAPSKAVLSGVRWAINRRDAMLSLHKHNPQAAARYKTVACIKVHQYSIGTARADGYIKTGILGLFNYEWKYDTSFFRTVDDLLKANENSKKPVH
jgi:hypothetical protein